MGEAVAASVIHDDTNRGRHLLSSGSDPVDDEFLAVITKRWLFSLAITISYDVFREVVPHRVKSVFGAEYVTGLRVLMSFLMDYCAKEQWRWMTWVLESGHRETSAAQKWLDKALQLQQFRLWQHAWVGKGNIDIHPADMLARVAATTYSDTPSPLVELLKGESALIIDYKRDDLQKAVQSVEFAMKRRKWQKEKLEAQAARRRRSPDILPVRVWGYSGLRPRPYTTIGAEELSEGANPGVGSSLSEDASA